jgi:Phytanoyl-CoA dioxygenase (PhyH)
MAGRGDKERFDDLVGRSPRFAEFAGHDGLIGPARSVINQPMRLIESYALRRSGPSVFYLHNGNSEVVHIGGGRTVRRNMGLDHTYHDGRLYCMFVKMLVYLDDVSTEDDGPFCYLQGSHKANFACFPEGAEAIGRPALTRPRFPSLETAPAAAGDAIPLNEALHHGTLPKSTPSERTVLAFGYAPAFVGDWKEIDIESADLARLGHY